MFSVIMDTVEVAVTCALLIRRKRKKRKRKYWVHPIVSQRLLRGAFHTLFDDLKGHPEKFCNYFRMSQETFGHLMTITGPLIAHQDTNMRKCVPLQERLAVTLR